MEQDLDEIEFPVLFKVCITPAFKIEQIIKSGYSNLWFYFMGKSTKSSKIYGWAGHTRNGTVISTPESILKDTVVDIKEVLKYIWVKFRGGKGRAFYTKTSRGYITATLRRPNYPSNCYDVDINKLTGGRLKEFYQIQFNFHPVNYKVEIILEDARRTLSRTYKYNKFGTSGSGVLISELDLPLNIYKYELLFRPLNCVIGGGWVKWWSTEYMKTQILGPLLWI